MSYIELRVEERVTERGERLEASVAAGACSDVYVVVDCTPRENENVLV
jgi:hypothetical protein